MPLVVFDEGGALLEPFVDAVHATIQHFFFLFEDHFQLLANFGGLLLKSFDNMRQIDLHLQNDVHQPFYRVTVHVRVSRCVGSLQVDNARPPVGKALGDFAALGTLEGRLFSNLMEMADSVHIGQLAPHKIAAR
jgi:hypothetical protein